MIELISSEQLELYRKEDLYDIDINDTEQIEELQALAGEMMQHCVDNKGEGLSATQIGIPKRFFVIRTHEDNFAIVINPSYVPNGSRFQVNEACLSYPERVFTVKRFRRIKVQFWTLYNDDFIYQRESMTGYAAEIFQHETNHCDGKTIAQIGKELILK